MDKRFKDRLKEKAQDKHDFNLYKKAIKRYKKRPITYTIEEVKRYLEI